MSDVSCATALVAFSSLAQIPSCSRTAMAVAHALRAEMPSVDGTAVVQLHETAILKKMISRSVSADVLLALKTTWLAVAVGSADVVEPLSRMLPQDPEVQLRVEGYLATTAFALSRLVAIENMYHILQRAFPYNDGVLPTAVLGRNWGQDGQDRRLVSQACLQLYDNNRPLRLQQFLPFAFDCTCSLPEVTFQGVGFAARVLNSASHELQQHCERAVSGLYRSNGGRAPLGPSDKVKHLGESLSTIQGSNAPFLLHLIVHDSGLLEGLGLVGFATTPTRLSVSKKRALTFALAEILESFPVVAFCSVERLRAAKDFLDSRSKAFASGGPPIVGSSGLAPIFSRSTFLEDYCEEFARACLRFEAFVYPPALPSPVPASKQEPAAAASAEKPSSRAMISPRPTSSSTAPTTESLASSLGRKKIVFDDEVDAARQVNHSSVKISPRPQDGAKQQVPLLPLPLVARDHPISPRRSPKDFAAAADESELDELEKRYSAIIRKQKQTAAAAQPLEGQRGMSIAREWDLGEKFDRKHQSEQHHEKKQLTNAPIVESTASYHMRYPTPPGEPRRTSPQRQAVNYSVLEISELRRGVAELDLAAADRPQPPPSRTVPTKYETFVAARPSPREIIAAGDERDLDLLEQKYANVMKKQATSVTLKDDRIRMESGLPHAVAGDAIGRSVPTPYTREQAPVPRHDVPGDVARRAELSRLQQYLDASAASMSTSAPAMSGHSGDGRIELRQPRQQGRSVLPASVGLAHAVRVLQRVGRGYGERTSLGYLLQAVSARAKRRRQQQLADADWSHHRYTSPGPLSPFGILSVPTATRQHDSDHHSPYPFSCGASQPAAGFSIKLPTPVPPVLPVAAPPSRFGLADVEDDLRREREERLRRRHGL